MALVAGCPMEVVAERDDWRGVYVVTDPEVGMRAVAHMNNETWLDGLGRFRLVHWAPGEHCHLRPAVFRMERRPVAAFAPEEMN